MTKIDIISGFLGAGKTTFIKKLLNEALQGEKIVLIENEFGEIGIDGGFLKEAGIQVSEMNSGCICCSLVGDFGKALEQVWEEYHPDRILIEPSGVGKLSDVMAAVEDVTRRTESLVLNSTVTVADASKVKIYAKNFGEFYNNQVEHAGTVMLSRTQKLEPEKLATVVELLKEKNPHAALVTTPWEELDGTRILEVMEGGSSLARQMMDEAACLVHPQEEMCCEEHHHGAECCGGHHHEHHHGHHHGEVCCDDHHHEHHHGTECCGGHDHGEACCCGHHHGHHHHADEVFTNWGVESPKTYGAEQLRQILSQLDTENYGVVLRAKGIVPNVDGGWLQFDYVPGEWEVRPGGADYTGRLCVIGSDLKEGALKALFGV